VELRTLEGFATFRAGGAKSASYAVWATNRNTFSLLMRPGTENIGAEFSWSYPITEDLRVYAQ
jgi:hypothetical protein